MTTTRDLRDRLLAGEPPRAPRAVDVPIPDGSIEVATGAGGIGVFLTVLTLRGRELRVAIGEDAAGRLATALNQAADASHVNRAAS